MAGVQVAGVEVAGVEVAGAGQPGLQLGQGGGDGEQGDRADRVPRVRGRARAVGTSGGEIVVGGTLLRCGGGREQVDQGVPAPLTQRPQVLEAVLARAGLVGLAQPGLQRRLAEGAEVEQGAQPAAVAGDPQVVALAGLGLLLGPGQVAGDRGGLGRVVDRGGRGQRLQDGTPGADQVPGGQ